MSAADNQPVEKSFLDMTDEEMLNAAPPAAGGTEVIAPTQAELDEAERERQEALEAGKTEGEQEAKPDAEGEREQEEEEDEDDERAEGGKPEGTESEAPKKDLKDAPKEKTEPVEKTDKVEKEVPAKEAPAVDYEAEYKRILAPFKANGHEIKVDSVEDAISLMQMGANYNKKMSALKPNLKLMKMLENSGFLSEEHIGFLIDLGKKDPAAINKLVKESGIDPMDLNADKANEYKPTPRTVSDTEMALDTVLDDLKSSPTYTQTLKIVGNQWDADSKDVIAKSPEILRVIDNHVANGMYALIESAMESERALGRLNGLSDIQAYRQVGDKLNAEGKFNHLVAPVKTKPEPVKELVKPKPKVDEEKLKEKKRAASSTRPAGPSTTASFNPLDLSDEEFSKLKPQFN